MQKYRGTMKNQCRILEVLRIKPLCFRDVAGIIFNGDRNSANRNLQALMSNGYVQKTRKGHKMMYSTDQKGLTDIEKQMMLKRLLEQPPWHETEEGKEWEKTLPPLYDETYSEEDLTRLRREYENEIKTLSEICPDLQKRTSWELIAWAKELRRLNKDKRRKTKTYGLREPGAGPRRKKKQRS